MREASDIANLLARVASVIDVTVYSQGRPYARSRKSQEPPAVQCRRCSDSKGYGEMKMAAWSHQSEAEEPAAESQHTKADLRLLLVR